MYIYFWKKYSEMSNETPKTVFLTAKKGARFEREHVNLLRATEVTSQSSTSMHFSYRKQTG